MTIAIAIFHLGVPLAKDRNTKSASLLSQMQRQRLTPLGKVFQRCPVCIHKVSSGSVVGPFGQVNLMHDTVLIGKPHLVRLHRDARLFGSFYILAYGAGTWDEIHLAVLPLFKVQAAILLVSLVAPVVQSIVAETLDVGQIANIEGLEAFAGPAAVTLEPGAEWRAGAAAVPVVHVPAPGITMRNVAGVAPTCNELDALDDILGNAYS